MDNYKPAKYFVENKLTTLSERQLRRKCANAYEMNVSYVKLSKNKNNSNIWLIKESSIELIGKRERKPKKKKVAEPYFNVEVTLNFNDRSDYAYYQEIVRIFKSLTGFDLVYKIEMTKDDLYSYHLHMGVHAKTVIVKKYIDYIVNNILGRSCNKYYDKTSGEHKSSIRVRKLIDEEAFIDYISKGYDRLGGDLPNYLFS